MKKIFVGLPKGRCKKHLRPFPNSTILLLDWISELETLELLLFNMKAYLINDFGSPEVTMSPAVIKFRYEKINDFKNLVAKHDPNQSFKMSF
ncbi:hypothetical protein IWX76_000551 [Pedobacter sp. CAN_A7]|uniref:hypothetical protein n=1 Tax=Pedobacter sp. CAN_A7 TaxID=2787722 RepID=UPI0018CBD04E